VLAAALLPAGMLGDRLGRRRMLIGALTLFGAASVACAYAQNAGQLIAARTALGLGAAVLMALTGAVLTVLFEPAERPRAMSVWVTASALGIPLGPLLGGWLLDNFWWGSVFLINVPVVLAGVIATVRWLPESHGDRDRRLDPLGIALSTGGLVVLTYGIIETQVLVIVAGVVLLAAFAWWQRRTATPMVDLALFRSPAFTWGGILATVASFALLGLLFALPQRFAAVDGQDALGAGLRLLPVIGGLLIGARLAERLTRRFGARAVIAGGLALIAGASFLGMLTGPRTGYAFIAAWITLTGLGLGLTMPPSLNTALGALSPERSGIGNAVLQAMRQVGGAIGVAVLGTVLSDAYRDRLAGVTTEGVRDSVSAGVAAAQRAGDPVLLDAVRAAFTHGMGRSLLVSGIIALLGAGLALAFLPASAPADRELAESRP
jgi:EmrB/QacA subfamily drug resistance transporter